MAGRCAPAIRSPIICGKRWLIPVAQTTIENIQSNASLFIALQAGTHITSQIGQVLLYDRRDDRLDPTSGYFASVGNDFAGVGIWR